MRYDDPDLMRFTKSTQVTGCHHIALSLTPALELVNGKADRSPRARAEALVVEAARRAAGQALDDYRMSGKPPLAHAA